MVVVVALTQMIGVRTPDPDIAIREGEEGVVVEIDNPTGAGEVVVEEPRSAHQGTNRKRKGAVPMTTPAWHLRPVSVIRTVNSRITEELLGNGVTAHR